ncbi:ubiquitin carboxyl-terminal hydrolase 3 isoform X2 [Drosophila ananassae]|nr:ubiquitin carboxyl-terminal hydrolase 3 isoform X2 [Drosophila ananassae]
MAQQTQPQQQQQQTAPPPSSSSSTLTGAAAAGGAGGDTVAPLSAPSTPQPSTVSGNNNNNTIVSPSGNNNVLTPVHALATAGQPVFNQMYMPAHAAHPHAGPPYPAMMPAHIPNVFVNNVTANVNLHGWSHSVPPNYLPGAQPHYIGPGDMAQEQGNTLMPHMQPLPINLAPQGGSPNPHNPAMGGGRPRGRDRGRGGGGNRRNDYHGPRHLQQRQQQHIVSMAPQQQLVPPDGVQGSNPGMQLQPELGQQLAPLPEQMQHMPYYATAPPHAYAYGPYPSTYFAPQHAPLQPPNSAAQQATGTPLFISPVMYNPICLGGYYYPQMMHPAEYPYLPEDAGQAGVDERVPQPDGGMPPMWHSAPMYAEEYAEVLQQQQQQQQQVAVVHANGVAPADEINHNSSSLPSSETSSMLSPNYQIYDPQMHDIHHQMGVMQIYDDGQMATLQPIHPGAAPVQQYEDELSECGVVPPPGAIPVTWAAAMPVPAEAAPQALLQAPPTHHIMQQTSPVLIEQQPQLVPAPPQAETPTPQHQPPQEHLADKNLINNNKEAVVALEEKLASEKQQQLDQDYHQQVQVQQQQQPLPTKVPNLVVATVAPQLQHQPPVQQQQPAPQQHQQQQTSPVVQHQHQPPQQQPPQQQQQQSSYHEQHHQQQQHQQQQQQPQRKPPQQYNQSQQHQQVRRKYSSEYNHHHHQHSNSNSSDTGIQTTKTMSWTNSAQHKKSTQSVSVTASPNSVNGPGVGVGVGVGPTTTVNQKSNYSHTTKTFTNQQHYQHQQQHYHNQNNYNSNNSSSNSNSSLNNNNNVKNNQPQVRNYGTMKVPSSPVASTAPTLERKNSQQGSAGVAPATTSAASSAIPAAITTATTSTASITATPNQFQQETATQAAPPPIASASAPAAATIITATAPPKSYATKKHQSYEPPVLSTVVASTPSSSNPQPPLNLAPPAPPASQNSGESAQLSWASLFVSNKPVAKVAPYEATKPPQQQPQHPVMQLAPPQPAPVAVTTTPQQLQLAPPQSAPLLTTHQQSQLPAPVPAPTVPLVTPGALSYSAASAQAVPASLPSPASVSVKPLKQEVVRPAQQLDEWTNKYAEYLTRHKTYFAPISLRPRGLTNRSNYCYINSILQALLGCSPFYNLLRSIPKQAAVLSEVKTPTVNAMMSFMSNFSSLPSGLRLRLNTLNKGSQNKGKDEFVGSDLQCDMAFEPTEIYKLWNDSREEHVEGRQEDAEEFLGYVLNKLNDEMLEVIKLIDKPSAQQNGQDQSEPEDGGDVWQICNNRNKGSVTRQTDFGRTPVSDIFRGELRSRLQREGEHSTDVIQPFFTLQLNIEKAASVKEALEILVGRDQLEGVTGSKTKQEVVAWQQMTLEKLPVVLILHLKYFDYRSDGCTKILKKVEFPVELKIDAKILGSKKTAQKQRAYRLFAVVYHDGKEASKGHYITDVFHSGYSSWLRYDDSSVKPVSEKNVLQPHTPRVPYLLYYRRSDTLPQQTQSQQTNGGGSGPVGSSSSNAGDK